MHSPPGSKSVSGLTAPVGVLDATLSTPAFFGVAEVVVVLFDDELPQALSTAAGSDADIPIVLPRRRNSRPFRRPATSSSM
jgi:hypothetical protein